MKLILALMPIFLLTCSLSFADMKSPEEFSVQPQPENSEYLGLLIPVNTAIRLYQIFISPVKQQNCSH